jgi:hypothetical protein
MGNRDEGAGETGKGNRKDGGGGEQEERWETRMRLEGRQGKEIGRTGEGNRNLEYR